MGWFQIDLQMEGEAANMRVIEEIVSVENINEAIKKVKSNKGVAGVDKMTVYEIEEYFSKYREEIVQSILEKKVQTSSSQKSLYTKKRWEEKTIRNTNGGR